VATDPIEIDFEIVPGQTRYAKVDYLPYGTKTLKIHSFVEQGEQPPLRLWPGKSGFKLETANLFVCHEDGGDDLWVTWGAGHEQGPWARSGGSPGDEGWPLKPGESGFSYLNVTHPNPEKCRSGCQVELKDYKLTVHAMTEAGKCTSCLEINLRAPRLREGEDGPAELPDPVRAQWQEDGANASTIRFEGTDVPLYVSRWWPTQKVEYRQLPRNSDQRKALEALHIEYERTAKDGEHWWNYLWSNAPYKLPDERGRICVLFDNKSLMEIGGNLGTHLFDERLLLPEVFLFSDQQHIVLRLWFLWVDKSRHKLHEVPDAERFDLLIDAKNRDVSFVGTDLHWREMWFKCIGHPAGAHVGLTFSKILEHVADQFKDFKDEVKSIFGMGQSGTGQRGNPVNNLVEILASPTPSGQDSMLEEAGLFKHVPTLDSRTLVMPGESEAQLTSTDVREVPRES
jgi:hypothetical protein